MDQTLITNNSPAMSEDTRALASAFLLAKMEFEVTGLGGMNSHQKYKYAKLSDIYDAVEASLFKNNIIIWHFARPTDGIEYLYTRLVHTISGQYIEDCRALESEKAGNQGKGAANTYMRKYAVLSLCALATEEDDDGEEEQRYIETKATLSNDQVRTIQISLKSCTNARSLYDNILKFNRVNDLSHIKASAFESIKSYIINNKE